MRQTDALHFLVEIQVRDAPLHYGSLHQVPTHVCTIIAPSMFAVPPLDSSILYYFRSSGASFSLKIPFRVWYFHAILLRFSSGNGMHG